MPGPDKGTDRRGGVPMAAACQTLYTFFDGLPSGALFIFYWGKLFWCFSLIVLHFLDLLLFPPLLLPCPGY